MRIALLGRTNWLLDTGHRLSADGHDIVLIATATAAPEYKVREDQFREFAERTGASFFLNPDVNGPEFIAALRDSGAEVAVSVNWPHIIREAACATLPKGIFNCHAGDLPRYRGNACPNWAILNGEPVIGVCCHLMDPGEVDAGPIYARDRMNVDENTYISDVYDWLDRAVPRLFSEAMARASDPSFSPEDQAASGVMPLRCHPRRPEDGLISWQQSATHIARLVRASSRPFAGAYTFVEASEKVTIWKARAVDLQQEICAVPGQIMGRGPSKGILVACGSGYLEIEEADGKLPVSNRYRLFGS